MTRDDIVRWLQEGVQGEGETPAEHIAQQAYLLGLAKGRSEASNLPEPTNWREALAHREEPLLLLEPAMFDRAIVGVAVQAGGLQAVAYDADTIIQLLIEEGLTWDDAMDHFEFNIAGAYVGPHTPVFLYKGEA